MEGLAPADQIEVKVFRPRSRLGGLAAGLDPAIPATVSLRKGGMSFGVAELLDNPVAALFGEFDLLFIVKFVLSLVAIVLSFNLICGEKESGTLRLVFSNPVPRDSVLLGKLLAALAIVAVPFTLGLLASLLLLLATGNPGVASGEQWAALGLLYLVSLLYLAAFVNLGALVSATTSRSLTAITLLLFLWAGLITLLPQAGGLIAETVYPVESTESFLLKKSLITEDIARQRSAELRPYFGHDDYEQIREPIATRYELELQRILTEMSQDYRNRRRNQQRIATALASLSPATPLTYAFTNLCGTGAAEAERFADRLEGYREQLNRELFGVGYRDFVPGVGGSLMISAVELANLPRFTYEPPTLATLSGELWPQVLLLVGFNLVFFVAAYMKFRRYDVR
jgi:ABC-type transport system involved in multi-copper enzyme maturation permease subunit